MMQPKDLIQPSLLLRLLLVLFAGSVASATLAAQARIDLGTLYVTYRTQMRRKQPKGELLDALRELDRKATTFYFKGKTGETRRLLGKALRLLRGETWNEETDFLYSLVLRTDMTVCDPRRDVIGRLEQIYPSDYDQLDRLEVKLSLAEAAWRGRRFAAGENLREIVLFPRLPRDLMDTPITFEADISGAGRDVLALSAEVIREGKVIHRMATPLYPVIDLDSKRFDMATRLDALSGPAGTMSSIRYPFQLASLLNLGRLQPRPKYDWISMLRQSESLLCSLELGQDPLTGATGDTHRHYYFEDADEIIPYRIYVPSTYDKSVPSPLIVVLHGLGGTENTFFERADGLLPNLCERYGYILVAPLGYRVNGGYGLGKDARLTERRRISELSEKDVMNVLGLVREEYLIDKKRIYLTGHSMGGNGTWHLASEYPEIWAGIAPCAPGAVNPDSIDISVLQNVPVLVIHGDQDMVAPVTASRRMAARMAELGMEYEYLEVAGGTHSTVVNPNLARIVEFFNKHAKE